MAWVRSEYAGELAVVAAWLSALLPWTVSVTTQRGVSFVVIRFPLFTFQFLFGLDLGSAAQPFHLVTAMPALASNPTNRLAYLAWLAAAAVLGAALLLAVAYYGWEQRIEAGRVDPVRLMGVLLGVAGVLLAASTVLLWQGYFGLTAPVGAVIVPVLGGVLLAVERTDTPS
ncbi:DUF7549 family protein [Halorarius halobius]|uniref:DUF7549 family protein n=1 Tax=Halorarius halobius TaxID=2962671 RepID=UPI0020CC91A3|nr:hypothetical protein [Halorarius halobius]